MSWDQYSQTPASNYLTGYFLTGMAPSSVKVAGSDIMADLAQFMSLPTSGGTANAQTITNTRQFGAWFTGMWVCWVPNLTNTGAMTIAPDGLAAKNVFANGAAALAGQVVLGIPAIGRYDGTQVQLINPQSSTGSFTLTFTTSYFTVQQTGTVNYRIGPDGKTVRVVHPNISGTSNATTLIGTGAPALLTSGIIASVLIWVVNSGTSTMGLIGPFNTASWQYLVGTNGAFANTGTKGVGGGAAIDFSYTL